MISRFFIDRPIFSAVLSIVITLAGAVAVTTLPVAQYPEIAPPTVQVTCSYPGANARVVADTIAAPIEQQVNGVERMLYMSSQCTNDGVYNLTITFELGTDLNLAQVLVQNRVALALPQLPEQVQIQGVSTKKKSPSILLAVTIYSPDGSQNEIELSNFATIYLKDELLRINGVGDISFLGQRDYSMRMWLDPNKLATRNLTAGDVVNAIQAQNQQVAAGQIGQQPVPKGQDFQLAMSTLGRLDDPTQFEDIIIKAGSSTSVSEAANAVVRVRDVARVELGAQNYDASGRLDGKPAVSMAIFQLPGSNALKTADAIKEKMAKLKAGANWQKGIDYTIAYDTTPFINESIHEVFKTLRDAVILVAIVVLVFLQNWRSTLIPLIAVPVAVVGTFAVMAVIGFSLNNISLLGLVLAIGIVVDDAIVVVENVERWLEHGLAPREAAIKAMEEVTGPVIAVALVLCAVFIPAAFITGITGQFFRQFALTIAVSTVISAFNSLTLSPALARILLRNKHEMHDPLTTLINLALGWFFKLFNRMFDVAINAYGFMVAWLLRLSIIVLAVYGGLLYLTYLGFISTPTGFIPNQDQGYLLVNIQLPDSASVQRTEEVVEHLEKLILGGEYKGKKYEAMPGAEHTMSVAGQSLLMSANGSNFGTMFVTMKDFSQRHGHDTYDAVIAQKIMRLAAQEIPGAIISAFRAPPVQGLGSAGGVKFQIEQQGYVDLDELQASCDQFIKEAQADPRFAGMFTLYRSSAPQLFLDIDRTKCESLGVPLSNVFQTLQVYMGGLYVNNFNKFGRSWQVNIQAEPSFRVEADKVKLLKVRNRDGAMVPIGTVANINDSGGPVFVQRYNMYTSAAINGIPRPGVSSGDVIHIVEEMAERNKLTIEWTEVTLMQILAGNTAIIAFALGTVLVFLVLAAQYESWSMPMAVILVVPMCLLCSVAGVLIVKSDMNIFTQIGFIVLVGLASKNAILIVEFAKVQREQGIERFTATVEASKLRLRPILMTSFAFILGVVPLMLSHGAGAEMRFALGIAVFSGMLGVTVFGIFLTPVFFYVIDWLSGAEYKVPIPGTPSVPHS